MSDKIIVSHDGALRKKYGTAGLRSVRRAVNALIKADSARRITTTYVSLDDAKAMKRFGAKPVIRASSQREVKRGIDAICAGADGPDYLMILGSQDVVPHQRLKNALWNPADPLGEDQWIPSDLPYACANPWSDDPADFIAPSRVVGRLADHTGSRSVAYLLGLLVYAASPKRLRKASIVPFGISTQTWQTSTNKSLAALFGGVTKTNTSPHAGPQWTPVELKATMHFINCHGGSNSPLFAGEPGDVTAHDAAWITTKIAPGTVASVECCYGAELYDPHKASGQQGIGQTYLDCGASAYFGSTNIAYGPATTNNYADLICRFFMEEVLKGRSSGDAALTARLRYASAASPIDAYDLKTLAQFLLLGDPSIHPVVSSSSKVTLKSAKRSANLTPAAVSDGFAMSKNARKQRRRESAETATVLERSAPVSSTPIDPPAGNIEKQLRDELQKAGVKTDRFTMKSFGTRVGAGPLRKSLTSEPRTSVRVHIASARPELGDGTRKYAYPVAVVAREQDGQITQVETIYGKSTSHPRRPRRTAARRRRLQERPRGGRSKDDRP